MDVHGRHFPPHQVFVNFRGDELRCGFVSHLVEALQRHRINVFIDKLERIGEDLTNLFSRIKDSTIALVIFSRRYTESRWCLDELVKIKERSDQGLLKVIPIFFKVGPVTVKQLRGAFGDQFRDREWEYRCEKTRTEKWKKALESVSCKIGLTFDKKSNESKFVRRIVREVKKMLQRQENFAVVRQRSILAFTQEPVELSREDALVQENSSIEKQVLAVSNKYVDIECANSVLRAEIDELSERLQSLNYILLTVDIGLNLEIPDALMNPWQIPYSSQPIVTSGLSDIINLSYMLLFERLTMSKANTVFLNLVQKNHGTETTILDREFGDPLCINSQEDVSISSSTSTTRLKTH